MYSSEDNLWLGQWLKAKKDEQQPAIVCQTDDEFTRVLKKLILKMLSYHPHDRPKIADVYKFIQRIMKEIIQQIIKGECYFASNFVNLFYSGLYDVSQFMNKMIGNMKMKMNIPRY